MGAFSGARKMNFGKLHLLLVHFPIALSVAAAGADILWGLTRRPLFRAAGAFCLIAALIATPFVVFTGWQLLSSMKLPADLADLAEDHEHMAIASLCIMAAAVAVRGFWAGQQKKWMLVLYGVLMAALFVCISITGHLGGKLAFGEDYLKGLFG
jgi:uncharacterized membrane protein